MTSITKLIAFGMVSSALMACTKQETYQSDVSKEAEADLSSPVISESPSLTLLNETAASLITNESVLYDSASETLYVSNIEGKPTDKDGKGSISIISKDGSIIEQNWVVGIDAPKGMGIANGNLYVTNIDELVEINIESASIVARYPVEDSIFLNDVATYDGKVFFTDMATGKVHLLNDSIVSTFSEGHESINGIAIDDNGDLFGLDASGLKKWNDDGTTTIINSVVTKGDGLIILDDENFIASRWIGEIWLLNAESQTLLLDTKAQESNTADIGFISGENLLFVPTFFKNKVAVYQLEY